MPDLSPWQHAPHWCLAFSGGLDSTVLLHLLARYPDRPPLRALHIHHGLQSVADTWPAHCQHVCARLGIELTVIPVQIAPGASLEQSARDARYLAFSQALRPGEILFTGQHREDQAETLLLRLLRGTGLRGLGAMPASRPLGQGTLARPLLDTSRSELEAYAREHALSWVEDPSNSDLRFSRNHLRHRVVPAVQEHWPQASRSLARTAAHLAEAQALLDELAAQDLAQAGSPSPWPWLTVPSLELAPLRRLSPARQRNALQHWLAPLTRLPDTRHWASWENLRDAAPDAQPNWRLADGELQRSGGRLYWVSGAWSQAVTAQVWENPAQALSLAHNGSVHLSGEAPAGPWHIRYRQGGETLVVPGRGRRDLKRLLNEAGLPPFVRARLPLLFRGDTLIAVANLPALGASALQLHWQVPTSEQGLA